MGTERRTARQSYMTKLIVAFRNFSKPSYTEGLENNSGFSGGIVDFDNRLVGGQ